MMTRVFLSTSSNNGQHSAILLSFVHISTHPWHSETTVKCTSVGMNTVCNPHRPAPSPHPGFWKLFKSYFYSNKHI